MLKIYFQITGHRAHTVYVGVHMPSGRRHSHRRHSHSHKHHHKEGEKSVDIDRPGKHNFYIMFFI